MDEITSNKEYRKLLYQVCEKAEGGVQPTAEELAVLQQGEFEKVGHVLHGIFTPYEGWRMRLQGAKFRRSVAVATGPGHKQETIQGKADRQPKRPKPKK